MNTLGCFEYIGVFCRHRGVLNIMGSVFLDYSGVFLSIWKFFIVLESLFYSEVCFLHWDTCYDIKGDLNL